MSNAKSKPPVRRITVSNMAAVKSLTNKGLKLAEIARDLGVPYNTAKYWLESAKKLESKMIEYLNEMNGREK